MSDVAQTVEYTTACRLGFAEFRRLFALWLAEFRRMVASFVARIEAAEAAVRSLR